jgi:hypothetical protein
VSSHDPRNYIILTRAQADSLRRKLIVAIAERARQVEAFKEINKSIPSETRTAWQAEIDAFIAHRTAPNPYMLVNKSTSLYRCKEYC